jgi:hypothetical protein
MARHDVGGRLIPAREDTGAGHSERAEDLLAHVVVERLAGHCAR